MLPDPEEARKGGRRGRGEDGGGWAGGEFRREGGVGESGRAPRPWVGEDIVSW